MSSYMSYNYDSPQVLYGLAGAATGITVVWFLYRKILAKFRRPPVAPCPPNTVQLFQFPRGPYCPSLSPFVLKLETYLRMAKIPYQNDFKSRFSKKGKIPWIRYNGEDVADTGFCIEFLNQKLGVDLNQKLTQQEKAVARAFQRMVDEALYWCGVYYRWVTDTGFKMILLGFKNDFMIKYMARPMMVKQCYNQGISRHTPDEIKRIAMADLLAIETFLGDKPFLMGDEPSEVDCSLFGLLAQVYWQSQDGVADKLIPEHYPRIAQYCERMKARFWPDWDDCITHGGTRRPIK